MNRPVLLVDDDAALCAALKAGLGARGFSVTTANGPEAALQLVAAEPFDVALCDLNMGRMNGVELCARILEKRPDTPVIMLTAFGSFETAVEAIRAGAYDFLSKPIKLDVLALALSRALERRDLTEEVRRLRDEVVRSHPSSGIVGRSDAMRRVSELIARVSSTDVSVLVTGESGTGKELIARAIHEASPRRDRPFMAINCAALPETLLESELFGHVRGAFTDAREARAGLLREADGGTVFLDEIGDMPLGLQPKLLRVLQEKTVRPLGSAKELPIDVRIVTATNQDLEDAIEQKRFREDLFFRINVVHIDLPPLRARGSADILALAQYFVSRFAAQHKKAIKGLSPSAADKLVRYAWPGNVRELMNSIERAVTLTGYELIAPDDLPPRIAAAPARAAWELPHELVALEEMERRYVQHVLEHVKGNKAAAARILRIERKTLYRKLEQWAVTSGIVDVEEILSEPTSPKTKSEPEP
jgi:DNA-binding NtrC family response regulator